LLKWAYLKSFLGKNKKMNAMRWDCINPKDQLGNLKAILSSSKTIDDDLFDALEDIFIQADIGVDTVIDFIKH
jgi:fused signal recognition particle receptor